VISRTSPIAEGGTGGRGQELFRLCFPSPDFADAKLLLICSEGCPGGVLKKKSLSAVGFGLKN